MGVKELRDAFNGAANPELTCSQAFLRYEYAHDAEVQILSFSGTDVTGATFEVHSDPLRPNTDLIAAAQKVARGLLDQRASQNEIPPAGRAV